MRWFVEIAPVGTSESDSYCVEANTWQEALTSARGMRGDAVEISGFSIELLEDGYRAIDPATRMRHVIRRAPDDAALSSRPPAAPSQAQSVGTGGSHPSQSPPGATPPRPSRSPKHEVLFRREEEPSQNSPLTYREYVYLIPPGTSETGAADVLRAELNLVLEGLAGKKTSKFVQLAAYDTRFEGKPTTPPLATLTWKDWRGEVLVAFPRSQSRSGSPDALPSSASAATAVEIPPAPKAPYEFKPQALGVPLEPAPAVVAPVAPVAPAPEQPALDATPAPSSEKTSARFGPPSSQRGLTPGSTSRVRSTGDGKRTRLRGDELITALFEEMHDLHFLKDALEGGEFCLSLAMDAIPSKLGLVHFYDVNRRQFVVARSRGTGADTLLLHKVTEGDPALSAAARNKRAVVWGTEPAPEGVVELARFKTVAPVASVMVAPIMLAGRVLGAIELVNPIEGPPFTDEEGNALSYISEQFSNFISSRGIILEAERISQAPPPPRA